MNDKFPMRAGRQEVVDYVIQTCPTKLRRILAFVSDETIDDLFKRLAEDSVLQTAKSTPFDHVREETP